METKKKIPGGFYLSLDGLDGCGKSTQLRLMGDRLKDEYDVVLVKEPGTTKAGRLIREINLRSGCGLSHITQMFLFSAARRDNFEKRILPALRKGNLVIADRCFDATKAYQGYGSGGDLRMIDYLAKIASCGRTPDLSFILDVDVKKGLENAGDNHDDIESKGIDYHKRVRQGYLNIVKDNPERCVRIPYISGGIRETHDKVYRITKERIDRVLKSA